MQAIASPFEPPRLLQLCNAFLRVARDEAASADELKGALCRLREEILFKGITADDEDAFARLHPCNDNDDDDDDDDDDGDGDTLKEGKKKRHRRTLRGTLWKALLGIHHVHASSYTSTVKEGECLTYRKIRNDSFRTFPSDEVFQSTVAEAELIRVLNCFVLNNQPRFTYCQGMNSVCAPFIFTMPEMEAYYTFERLLTKQFPLYWVAAHIGAQAGCVLVDRVLKEVDGELFAHLESHKLSAYLYAFSCISSLSASVPPFTELLQLWDFLIAFGPHFNILCVAAQIISLREDLLKSKSPKSILDYRKWPQLRARYIINVAMSLLPQLPKDLYNNICLHATDPAVASAITGRAINFAP